MADVTKISEITTEKLAKYLHIAELTEDDTSLLTTLLDVAKKYIYNYTGLNAETADSYTDLVIVAYVLVQDMYDNRTMYVDNSNVNTVVETILGMHQRNLL